jgi:hypothetical protein
VRQGVPLHAALVRVGSQSVKGLDFDGVGQLVAERPATFFFSSGSLAPLTEFAFDESPTGLLLGWGDEDGVVRVRNVTGGQAKALVSGRAITSLAPAPSLPFPQSLARDCVSAGHYCGLGARTHQQ